MIIKLKNLYPCKYSLPIIHSVDTDIFELTYFKHCMQCTFCNDQCCEWGADIDMLNVNRILEHKNALEEFTGIESSKWFDDSVRKWDHEYPGGNYTRTSYINEKKYCVFHESSGRGCMLHSFAHTKGLDFHDLKPFFCAVFPVTYDEGVLTTPEEIDENLTACLGNGESLYSGARDALKYYFGSAIIDELDTIEKDLKKNHIVHSVKNKK